MSVYSSVASSSGRPPRPSKKGGEDGEDGEDLLDQRQSLEAGVFGVLFTLSKEKSENNWKFCLVKAILDFWQLFVTVIDPVQGWNINPDSTIWKVVGFWNFIILQDQGYTVYVAVLYCVVALLVLNLLLCVWVAVSFKKRQFDYVWPIQVLRIFTSVFFQVFDIASLNLLQIGISCQYVGVDSDVRGHVYLFPDVACLSMPHLLHAVVSALTLVVFVLVALLLNMAEVELNPLSHRPSSTGHSGPEVWGFAIKAGMTLVNAFTAPGWLKVQSILMTALSGMLTWLYFRWSPHMVGWMNHVKVGSYTAVVNSAVLSIVLLFHPGVKAESLDSFRNSLTKAMLALLAPMGLLGAVASYLRLRLFSSKVVGKYRTAPLDARPKEIYKFKDPRDVEVVSRVARKWIKMDVVDPKAVAQAETVIKAGLTFFPNDAYMTLVYANFLIDTKDNSPAGYRQLQAAGKLKPNAMCRFMIFVREQEQQQRAASSNSGGNGPLDLVSYVEFQKSQRMVMRHHKEALLAICAFWQVLLRNHVSFKSLAQALNKIEKSVSNAEMAYKVALERYTDSYKLMRLYGKFLQLVKNDPWRATEYFEEAERLANKQDMETANGDGQGGMPRVDDSSSAVVVINGRGIIQLTNKATVSLFGYKKGELEAKNVTILMPAPFSQKHHGALKQYTNTDEPNGYLVGKASRQLVGLHLERYGFPLKISITKASGTGEDATFMGIIEPVTTDPNICLAWINRSGIISCVDQRFSMWFGYSPAELLGANMASVLRVEGGPKEGAEAESAQPAALLTRLIDDADAKPLPENLALDQLPSFQASPAAVGLAVVHKYGGSVQCQTCIVQAGSHNIPLHLVMLRRLNPEPNLMLVADPKGALRHLSSDLAIMLGYANGAPNLNILKLTDLMHPTWGIMHAPKWLKEPDPVIPASSCRAAQNLTQHLMDVKGKPVLVRMSVETTDEHGEPLHIVKMTKSSLQQAVDDRRLQLTVDHRGVVTAVLGTTPPSLFGLEPKALIGKPLHSIVPLLADPEANGGQDVVPVEAVQDEFHDMGLDAFATPVLNALIKKAMDRPGYSWRVGVSPPGEEAAIRKQVKDPALVQSMLAKVCKPAVMQMDVTTNTSAVYNGSPRAADRPDSGGGSHLSVVVNLWRADLLSVCVEVDKDGGIMKVENDDVCPPGLLFGVPSLRLRGDTLMKLLCARSLVDLGAEQEKKGGLKTSSSAQANAKMHNPTVVSKAQHHDSQPLSITTQVVVKAHKRWVLLHLSKPTRGNAAALAALLPSSTNSNAHRSESQFQFPLGDQQLEEVLAPAPPAPVLGKLPSMKAPTATARIMERSMSTRKPAVMPTTSPRMGSPPGAHRPPLGEGMSMEMSDQKDSAFGLGVGAMESPARGKSTRFALPNQPMAAIIDSVDQPAGGQEEAQFGSRGSHKGDSAEEMMRMASKTDELKAEGGEAEVDMEMEKLLGRADSRYDHMDSAFPMASEAVLGQTDIDGEGAGGSDGEGSDHVKALNGAKMARISTWVATDGEEYPVGGQTDLEPDSRIAKGLKAGVAKGAVLVGDDENDDGDHEDHEDHDEHTPMVDTHVRKHLNHGLGYIVRPSNKIVPLPRPAQRVAGSEMDADSDAGGGNVRPGRQSSAVPAPSDDGHSDGGDSAGSGASKMSGMSGMSGMSEEDNQDYRRGKRYRKLAKMLDGAEAQRVTRRFNIHTLCLVGLLLLAQTVSFAMMVVKINLQMTFMQSLSSSGYVSRYNMEINLYIRTIDNIMTNKTVPGIYEDGLEYYVDKVTVDNEDMHNNNEFIYFQMEGMHQLDDTYGLRTAFDVTPRTVFLYQDDRGRDVYSTMTLWELLARFHTSVNKYLHKFKNEYKQYGTTANLTEFQFIKNNGLTLYTTYREVLDALLYKAVANTDAVNQLHIIFLVLEGCVLCSIVTAYFAILLRQVSNQRYALYSVFIIIPIGLVRALANQSVKLLDDSDSEEDDDDDGPHGGGGGGGGGEDGEDKNKYGQQQDPKALRKEIHTLNKKPRASLISEDGRPTSGAINVKMNSSDMKSKRGCFARFAASLRHLLGIAEKSSSKRQLVRDSKETTFLMLPIIVWGLLVMVIYVAGYISLKNIAGPVADQNVINYVAGRTLRAAFFAQEYVTQEDPSKSKAQQANLVTHISRLNNAVQVMLVGSEAYTLRGVNESFALVEQGVTYSDASVASILFDNGQCLRKDPSRCRTEDNEYYAISREGLIPMMYDYLDHLNQLQNATHEHLFRNGSTSAMESEEFQMIWNVGSLDLNEAVQALVAAHEEAVLSMFSEVRTLHIILFVLGWIFASLFLLLLLRPLLKRSRRETRRIAELLSQLPPELNVEKLVLTTLKVQINKDKETKESSKGPGNSARNERGGGGDKDDDTKDWKTILSSSFSVSRANSKTMSR